MLKYLSDNEESESDYSDNNLKVKFNFNKKKEPMNIIKDYMNESITRDINHTHIINILNNDDSDDLLIEETDFLGNNYKNNEFLRNNFNSINKCVIKKNNAEVCGICTLSSMMLVCSCYLLSN